MTNTAVSAILRHLLEVPGQNSLQETALNAALTLQHPLLSGWGLSACAKRASEGLCASQASHPDVVWSGPMPPLA